MLSIDQLTINANPGSSRPLLDALSFTVHPREAVALIGPSGCGKTTLLRSIAGLIDPVNGIVTLGGQSPGDLSWPTFRRKVMLVPQRPVTWDATLGENLARPQRFQSISHAYVEEEARGLLSRVGLADKLNAAAHTLSEGERQRVCLVRALLTNPDFMLLDEPTSALDEESVRGVELVLSKAMAESTGPGVLVATHDRAFADRFCARVIDLTDYIPAGKAVAHD